jgi:hypothetical protein
MLLVVGAARGGRIAGCRAPFQLSQAELTVPDWCDDAAPCVIPIS